MFVNFNKRKGCNKGERVYMIYVFWKGKLLKHNLREAFPFTYCYEYTIIACNTRKTNVLQDKKVYEMQKSKNILFKYYRVWKINNGGGGLQ